MDRFQRVGSRESQAERKRRYLQDRMRLAGCSPSQPLLSSGAKFRLDRELAADRDLELRKTKFPSHSTPFGVYTDTMALEAQRLLNAAKKLWIEFDKISIAVGLEPFYQSIMLLRLLHWRGG
jgi:hypothetical protein